MHDAAGVGGGEGVGERNPYAQELGSGQASRRRQLAERAALDELHGEETPAGVFLDRVDGHDAGMIERRDRARLALEASETLAVRGELFPNELERHVALEPGVARQEDLAHTARAERAQDAVVGEGGSDHRGLLERTSILAQRGIGDLVSSDHIRRFYCLWCLESGIVLAIPARATCPGHVTRIPRCLRTIDRP